MAAEHAPQGANPRRRGQVASERARYDLGTEPASEPGLGALPDGYGLTFVRGWVRDPRHVVVAWDLNDADALHQADAIGWDRLCLRAIDARNRVLVQNLVGRQRGTHHLAVPSGRTVRLAMGLERFDGRFLTLARSGTLRMPPERRVLDIPPEILRIPPRLDRRLLLRADDPGRPGHRTPGRIGAGWRLRGRLIAAAAALPPDRVPPDLAEIAVAAAAAPELSGLQPIPPPSAGPAPFDDDRAVPSAESPDAREWRSGAGSSPRHWLERWSSGRPGEDGR